MDTRFNRWKPIEDDLLFAMKSQSCSTEAIAMKLGRTECAVRERYHRLVQKRGWPEGAPRRVRRPDQWTLQADNFLMAMRDAGEQREVIARKLNRTIESIDARCRKLRIARGIPLGKPSRKKASVPQPIIQQAPPSPKPSRAVRNSMLEADAELLARIELVGITAGLCGDPLPGRSALDKRNAGTGA